VAEQMPETAAERIRWIGQDPERAQAALDDEDRRGDDARSTVMDHAERVLDAESQADDEDEEYEEPVPVIEMGVDLSTAPEAVCSVHGGPAAECAELHESLSLGTRQRLAGGFVSTTDEVPEPAESTEVCSVHGGQLEDCADLHSDHVGWAIAEEG
jgi:hypothetical protein